MAGSPLATGYVCRSLLITGMKTAENKLTSCFSIISVFTLKMLAFYSLEKELARQVPWEDQRHHLHQAGNHRGDAGSLLEYAEEGLGN